MASSSSSHKRSEAHGAFSVLQPPGQRRKSEESVRLYDVFINHRGPDVKETLASQLYNSLEMLGIRAFLDSEEKEFGESFPSTIETAIRSAKVHIAIFSKRYAESPWCLAELALMLETEAKIIPLFYGVEPWEIRHIEKGCYAEAFRKYEEKSRHTEMLPQWKDALYTISFVAGHVISDLKSAAGDCKEIVLAVRKEMQKIKFLDVAKYPVGLSKLVQELERRCLSDILQDFESQCGMNEDCQGKARIVSIYGMGGTGKTTLSKELFNRYCSKYTRSSFLFDVREASARSALPSLQLKLIKDLFDEDHSSFISIGEGKSCLQDRLGRIQFVNFLIVLDDIDHSDQLDNLLITDVLNKPGNSLIIITTRDAGVLMRAGIPTSYNLKGIDQADARELFCLHAFGKSNPGRKYEDLVKAFVDGCGGIPLSLQVLGSHVKGRDQKYWRSALRDVLKTQMHEDIKQKLKISFDSLRKKEKQIFMDIACFFIGTSKNVALKIWEGSGWEPHHALETLKEKCLVQEIEKKHLDGPQWEWDGIHLGMHDHLRDLGREMAVECTAPLRIWKPEDRKSLESKRGFRSIIKKTKGRCFHSLFDTSMGSQITYFLAEKSASLLWLQLDLKSPVHPSVPSFIPLKKLQCLRISNGRLQRLWHSTDQAPLQLKELQISETFLEEVPDLGMLNNLESVVLDVEYMAIKGWSLLESLRMNISTLCLNSLALEGKFASANREEWTPFGSLIIRNFNRSTKVALNKFPMSGLENLQIGNQESVTEILISGNHCPSLETLKFHRMKNLIEIDLLRVKTLNSLKVEHCENLKRVPGISDLTELVELNISECPELESELCLSSLYCLERITVDSCRKLKCFELTGCQKLVELNISQCAGLESELCLRSLYCLERITVDRCRKLKCLELIDCKNLVELNISDCPDLESELCLRSLYCLEMITVDRCRKLKCLGLIDCKKLNTVSGMEGLDELATLNIRDCPQLLQLPADNLSCWERIKIEGCEKLNTMGFYSLLNLKIITFDIGRAVEGAELILNSHLFSEVIGADAVTEMDIPCTAILQASVSQIIICGLVVVERSFINYRSQEFHLPKGRWIVTMVIADAERNTGFISAAVEGMCYGIVDKGLRVTLMKGQEGKTRHVLQTIDDKLYQK